MDKIEHRTVKVNEVSLHVAEVGEGPVVLFVHGFPELWYSWRHQMLFLASRGYRAVAPDLRGFGDTTTDAPPSPAASTTLHVAGDLVALLDALRVDKAFLVGHDFGSYHAWNLCLFRPDRIIAYVGLSVPYFPRNPAAKFVEAWRAALGDDYYICRFQEPGVVEEELARRDTATIIKKLFTMFDEPKPPIVPKEIGFCGKLDEPVPSPSWLSEEDLSYYVSKHGKTGYTGGLNYYRALDTNWELMAAWTGAKVKVPAKFVVGELDLTYNSPGLKDYVHGGGFKEQVPHLEEVVVVEGAAHFLQQEKPDEINSYIYDFIQKF